MGLSILSINKLTFELHGIYRGIVLKLDESTAILEARGDFSDLDADILRDGSFH